MYTGGYGVSQFLSFAARRVGQYELQLLVSTRHADWSHTCDSALPLSVGSLSSVRGMQWPYLVLSDGQSIRAGKIHRYNLLREYWSSQYMRRFAACMCRLTCCFAVSPSLCLTCDVSCHPLLRLRMIAPDRFQRRVTSCHYILADACMSTRVYVVYST